MAKTKLPKDANQRAIMIAQIATGEIEAPQEEKTEIQKAAAVLGRKGGLIGGKARAAKLSAKKRSEIAKKAADKRWRKK
jgi:hypothetical protein